MKPEDQINYIKSLCLELNVDYNELINNRRGDRNLCDARHIICACLYGDCEMTLKEVGRIFKRHHTTIMNSIKQTNDIPKLRNIFLSKSKFQLVDYTNKLQGNILYIKDIHPAKF